MKTLRETSIVADCDEFFRMALGVILKEQLGFQLVVAARCISEVCDLLKKDASVQLCVLDSATPGFSTGNVTTLRQDFPNLAVAIVSSSMRREDVFSLVSAGAHGYVAKSGGAADMTRALQTILDGALWIPTFVADVQPLSDLGTPGPVGFLSESKFSDLTPRQLEVLKLVSAGQSNKEIARKLNLREGTVKVHMAGIFRNLGVSNRSSAAVLGARLLGQTYPE